MLSCLMTRSTTSRAVVPVLTEIRTLVPWANPAQHIILLSTANIHAFNLTRVVGCVDLKYVWLRAVAGLERDQVGPAPNLVVVAVSAANMKLLHIQIQVQFK